MSRNALERKVLAAVSQAVEMTPEAGATDIARHISVHHSALIQEWAFQKLVSLCRSQLMRQNPMKRGRPTLQHQQQLRLPGFEHIPIRFEIQLSARNQARKQILLRNATLADLKKRRALLRGEFSPELPELNRLISIMQRYDESRPGITVAEAFELRAARKKKA
jgi:hypothetical protein